MLRVGLQHLDGEIAEAGRLVDRIGRRVGIVGEADQAVAAAESPGFHLRKLQRLGIEASVCLRIAHAEADRDALHPLLTRRHQRSEEHTSELQSLMRITSAAFCLKKKISTP